MHTWNMIMEKEMHDKPCVHCGQHFGIAWVEETRERLIAKCRCFICDFWMGHVEDPHPHRQVDDQYGHHVAAPGIIPMRGMMGSGGRAFLVKQVDGTQYLCNNVWHQGTIPARFRHLFPVTVLELRDATLEERRELARSQTES